MAFNWKELFIVDEEAERMAAIQKVSEPIAKPSEPTKTSFPVDQKPNIQSAVNFNTDNEAFTEVLAVYEKVRFTESGRL